jgi:hypothetical protein
MVADKLADGGAARSGAPARRRPRRPRPRPRRAHTAHAWQHHASHVCFRFRVTRPLEARHRMHLRGRCVVCSRGSLSLSLNDRCVRPCRLTKGCACCMRAPSFCRPLAGARTILLMCAREVREPHQICVVLSAAPCPPQLGRAESCRGAAPAASSTVAQRATTRSAPATLPSLSEARRAHPGCHGDGRHDAWQTRPEGCKAMPYLVRRPASRPIQRAARPIQRPRSPQQVGV